MMSFLGRLKSEILRTMLLQPLNFPKTFARTAIKILITRYD